MSEPKPPPGRRFDAVAIKRSEFFEPAETLEEANSRLRTVEQQLLVTQAHIERLNDLIASGGQSLHQSRQETGSQTEESVSLAPVDTRNPVERICDGVANGIRAWWDNMDPRRIGEKDRIWKIGLVAGVIEGAVVNLSPIPGGRIAINALNFLVGQGAYVVGETLRQAEIASVNRTFEGNDAIQRILDANDRHIDASRKIRNLFLGAAAGITYTSLAGIAFGIGENIVSALHPSVETAAQKVITKIVEKPFGWTPESEAFNPVIIIPDDSNFWNAWHIDASAAPSWTDLHNGTTHTDVIKDMVVKLARANGHELGLVHAGDHVELGKVLTTDQLDLVKKAAGAKSYREYLSAIRPAYQLLLRK